MYADAPAQPNVYTDGSWLHGTKQFLGIGGAGVWWPKRQLNKNGLLTSYYKPISEGKEKMCFIEQNNDGVNCYSNTGGFSGSSTGTELAAGILAILAHGPIHIASDNKGFVSKTIKLINRINDQHGHKIHWGGPEGWRPLAHHAQSNQSNKYQSLRNLLGQRTCE